MSGGGREKIFNTSSSRFSSLYENKKLFNLEAGPGSYNNSVVNEIITSKKGFTNGFAS